MGERPLRIDPLCLAPEARLLRRSGTFLSAEYLWLLSVQYRLRLSGNFHLEPRGEECETICRFFEKKMHSTLRLSARFSLATCREGAKDRSMPSSSRLIRASKFRLNAAVTPSSSS